MKIIKLSTGENVMVDDSDYDYLMNWKWYPSGGYAISGEGRIKMHRLIMKAKDGQLVDHIDRNKLNNTRSNLRIVNKCENIHNQKKRDNTANRFKGVTFVKRLGLWQARCRMNLGDHFLGYFTSEMSAAYAYNKKALELSDCALVNELPYSIDRLEEMLISDRATIPPARKQSKQKGVYWNDVKNKWEPKIRVKGKYKYIGSFVHEADAINAINAYRNGLLQGFRSQG